VKQLLRWLFVCRCTRLSFPISRREQKQFGWRKLTGDYVVCLDCGAEYPYDWKKMRRLEQPKARKVERQLLPLVKSDEC
jgi:hypothetical protein